MPLPGSAASRLCTACGMCCDGTMFHQVRLQPGDTPKAIAALGLKLKRKHKQNFILQPCPAHRESCCSIYAARPERCRLFECLQIRRLGAGEQTEAMAAQRIRAALNGVEKIRTLLRRLGEKKAKGPLTIRCEKALAEPLDPESGEEPRALRRELIRSMDELDSFLEKYFRPPRP